MDKIKTSRDIDRAFFFLIETCFFPENEQGTLSRATSWEDIFYVWNCRMDRLL